MTTARAAAPNGRVGDEPEHERLNRNLADLLNEIRVAMPGVQVLFGFLLAVPFQARFGEATGFQRGVYFVTLLCSAAATACFIAPTAYHRLLFRQGEKEQLVFFATRMAIAGLVTLAVAMTGAVLLISDVLVGGAAALVTGAAMGLLYVALWFVLPVRRRVDGDTR
ncbi:MAG: DUF6328 family protein [Solirubrobacteraceae bacterium]